MAACVCPQCMGKVPATLAMALSDGMECPHCHSQLEVATGSRMVAIWTGLAAGWVVWHFTTNGPSILDQVLPELYSILVFGFVSALVLMFTADLRLAPAAPVAAAPAAGHAPHAGHH